MSDAEASRFPEIPVTGDITMSVDLGRATLFKEFEIFRVRWADTDNYWKDAVRAEFEKDKIMPLEASVLTTLSALDRPGRR